MKKIYLYSLMLSLICSAVAQGIKPAEQKEKTSTSSADEKKAQSRPQPRPMPTNAAQVYNNQLSNLEREMISAAEAMPADKFDFKPATSLGEFKESRSFKQQIGHVAANNFLFASWLTGEKLELSEKDRENGPAMLTDKESTLKYLKDSFAAAHKAVDTVRNDNIMEAVPTMEGGKMPRMGIANIFLWHGFDHYGQMALYLRMNNIVPPASRPRQ